MADFEDANCPTWDNMIEGQLNLRDAIRRTITFEQGGKQYKLATDRRAAAASARLAPRREARDDRRQGRFRRHFRLRPLLLPQRERAARARLGPVFLPAEDGVAPRSAPLERPLHHGAEAKLGVPHGSIRATCLIETLPAAFEMDEFLWELKDHSAGLNIGRWDYIFSCIKKFAPTRTSASRTARR